MLVMGLMLGKLVMVGKGRLGRVGVGIVVLLMGLDIAVVVVDSALEGMDTVVVEVDTVVEEGDTVVGEVDTVVEEEDTVVGEVDTGKLVEIHILVQVLLLLLA